MVIQEDARRDGDTVEIPALGGASNIRPAGLDFRAGDTLLKAGVRLDPWRLALAAAAGRPALTVARRPVVAILSTGEEVVEPGTAPGPFQIFNSGSTALAGLVTAWGGAALTQRPVEDDRAAITEAVRPIACDLLVTIGGASVGDHDLVKPALEDLGLELVVESIAMRPGKPTSFGTLRDGRRVLGLPGNPASALACAELFLGPMLRAMLGANPGPKLAFARTTLPLPANGPREHWMRATNTDRERRSADGDAFPRSGFLPRHGLRGRGRSSPPRAGRPCARRRWSGASLAVATRVLRTAAQVFQMKLQ